MSAKDRGTTLLAMYGDPETAARACRCLRDNGFAADALSVLSSSPYPEEVFAVYEPRPFLQWVTLAGGVVGIGGGVLLTVGTSLLYPIRTGHMSILPIPPYAIITYELMMLSAIVATVIAFAVAILRGWRSRDVLFDQTVHEDQIGVLVFCADEDSIAQARRILDSCGPGTLRQASGNHL